MSWTGTLDLLAMIHQLSCPRLINHELETVFWIQHAQARPELGCMQNASQRLGLHEGASPEYHLTGTDSLIRSLSCCVQVRRSRAGLPGKPTSYDNHQ